jgi:hypothetical protein
MKAHYPNEEIKEPKYERDIGDKDSDSIYSFDVDLEDDPLEDESVIYQTRYHPTKANVH